MISKAKQHVPFNVWFHLLLLTEMSLPACGVLKSVSLQTVVSANEDSRILYGPLIHTLLLALHACQHVRLRVFRLKLNIELISLI